MFGLRGALHKLVNALKSAAFEYGIEKRVLLLHGPVGSSKSTIARLRCWIASETFMAGLLTSGSRIVP